jgi:Ca2+-binding EF-hand superfamily protein
MNKPREPFRGPLSRFGLMIVLLLLASSACAQHGASPRMFSVHDTDRDGYLDRGEYRTLVQLRRAHQARRAGPHPSLAPAFDELDSNEDGRVSEAELTRMLRTKRRRYRVGNTHLD